MINKYNAFLYGLFLLPAGLPAQQLYVGSNTSIVMSTSGGVAPKIVLNNAGFICNGSLQPDTGTVLFTGNAGADIAVIGGAGAPAFYNLTISKSSSNVRLVGQASVKGMLTMNNGNLLLNNHTLDLGSTGSLAGEKDQSRVTGNGYITANRMLNAPKLANLGNLGLTITSTANMGTVTVLRSDTPYILPNGMPSIARSYTVYSLTPGGGRTAASVPITGPAYSFSIHYLNAELNGLSKPALNIWSGGPGAWSYLGRTALDTANNLVSKSGITSLGTFTIGLPPGSNSRISKEEPTLAAKEAPTAQPAVQLYPNPAHDHCTLVVYGTCECNDIISLYNASGSLLQQKQVSLHDGINKMEWDLHTYSAGTYYIRSGSNAFKSIVITRL